MAVRAYLDAATDEPLTLAGFVAGKIWFAWTAPARGVMESPPWRAVQLILLIGAAAGLLVGLARRRFDVIVLGSVLLAVTLVHALYIASPRRTLVLLPEVSALAGLGLTWGAGRLRQALRTRG
jgi:hypothetical protein